MTADTTALQSHPAAHGAANDPAAGVHAGRGVSNVVLGMILFITSEVMFFSGLFAAYFATRFSGFNQPWPPEAFSHILDPLSLILPATVILVLSSFTCQFAVWSIRKGDRQGFVRNIGVTFVLGIIFLIMQAYDYAVLYSEGLTLGSGAFGTTYYTLTGFHGAHVFVGLTILTMAYIRVKRARDFSPVYATPLNAGALYWHFVDVVWVLLFILVYLI